MVGVRGSFLSRENNCAWFGVDVMTVVRREGSCRRSAARSGRPNGESNDVSTRSNSSVRTAMQVSGVTSQRYMYYGTRGMLLHTSFFSSMSFVLLEEPLRLRRGSVVG